jgi:hypothetical protein
VLEEVLGIPGVAPVPAQSQFDQLATWFAANADLDLFKREFL